MIDRDQIIEVINRMPSMAPASFRVLEMANDLETPENQIVREIEQDPVIAAKIIGLVNSSFYGLSREVTSLSQCVILLGYNTVKNIALSTIMTKIKDRHEDRVRDILNDLWLHMVATGVLAKNLSRNSGHSKYFQNFVFNCGLIHNLGNVVMVISQLENVLALNDIAKENQTDLDSVYRMKSGFDSKDVGKVLSIIWKLPENLSQIISGEMSSADEVNQAHHLIELSSRVCMSEGIGFVSDFTPIDLESHVENAGFKMSSLNSALSDLKGQITEVANLLGLSKVA